MTATYMHDSEISNYTQGVTIPAVYPVATLPGPKPISRPVAAHSFSCKQAKNSNSLVPCCTVHQDIHNPPLITNGMRLDRTVPIDVTVRISIPTFLLHVSILLSLPKAGGTSGKRRMYHSIHTDNIGHTG